MVTKLQSRDLYAIMNSQHPDFPGGLSPSLRHQAYNGLDSAVTLRVHSKLAQTLAQSNSPHARISYAFVRAMQGPALDMMLTGVMIQQKVRQDETTRYLAVRNAAQAKLDLLADAIWGPEYYIETVKSKAFVERVGKRGNALTPKLVSVSTETLRTRPRGLNPASPKQVLDFFNNALGFPVEFETRKGKAGQIERTPTANDKALRKWANKRTKGPGIHVRDKTVHPVRIAEPFASLILTIRDADKMLGVLRTPLDPDGRMRCSYNVAGTENARWSSSKNVFGRGTNLQNVTPTMRRMFCADDGQRIISTDLEQAESYVVAAEVWRVTGDRTYWNAILSGDLHTQVCRMAWPELGWTGDPKLDRKIADQTYPALASPDGHGLSYRDVAKRIGHGSNYRGSSFGIAAAVGIPHDIVADFQARYYSSFPAILEWHAWVKAQLLNHQHLDTPLLRRRWFFARPNEDSTLREAIAFVPQSTVGELLNLIMLKCWLRSKLPKSDPAHLPITLLLQNHDAFLFQVPEAIDLPWIISQVNLEFQSALIPVVRGDHTESLSIPGEFVTGWNWAYQEQDPNRDNWNFKDGNPDGLAKWRGSDSRKRIQSAKVNSSDWLGGPLSRVY